MRSCVLACVALLACGSQEIVDLSGEGTPSAADATVGAADGYAASEAPPTIAIVSPPDGVTMDAETVTVTGTAWGWKGVAAVKVRSSKNVFVPASDTSVGFRTWSVTLPLAPGDSEVVARVVDTFGATAEASVTVHRPLGPYDGTAPVLAVQAPEDGFETSTDALLVTGTAYDPAGVALVEITVDSGPWVLAETDDAFEHFALPVAIPPGPAVIAVRAADVFGNETGTTVVGQSLVPVDSVPPQLSITSPGDGATLSSDSFAVKGTAADAAGLFAVEVKVGDGPWLAADSQNGFENWQRSVAIVGPTTIRAKATDANGLTALAQISVDLGGVGGWGPAVPISLTWAPPDYATQSLELDKSQVVELFTPAKQKKIVLLKLAPTPLVKNSLAYVQGACGSGWWKAGFSDAGCPWDWSEREKNIWRLMTMTPANVNVEGTSIAGVAELAATLNGFGLIDSFSEILAAALGIGLYDEIVSPEHVGKAMVEKVMGTHPNTNPDHTFSITLEDAMSDMETLGPRYDAKGTHPGFIDSTYPTIAAVMEPDFKMHFAATSNLQWHDGIDLDTVSKGYVPVIADVTGPTYDDVLEFDFLSQDGFWVTGLTPNPTVTLWLKLYEHDGWVPEGTTTGPLPRGNSPVWNDNPWEIESVLGWSAWFKYQDRRAGCDLCLGKEDGALLWEVPILGTDESEIVVGRAGYDKDGTFGQNGVPDNFDVIDPNPAGWMRTWTLFGLGDPPAPQYLWDMIMTVSERRLQDGGVAEGEGDMLMELPDIEVGMTGAQMVAAMRPSLESQTSELSKMLIGPDLTQGDDVDVWIDHDDAGDVVLVSREQGFFADEAHTQPIGLTVTPNAGETVYIANVRIDIQDVSGPTVLLEVRQKQ